MRSFLCRLFGHTWSYDEVLSARYCTFCGYIANSDVTLLRREQNCGTAGPRVPNTPNAPDKLDELAPCVNSPILPPR